MIRRVPRDLAGSDPGRPFFAEAERPPLPSVRSDRARSEGKLAALLADELTLAPARIIRLCERELGRLRGAREVRLHLHPEDLALLPSTPALSEHFELLELTLIEDAAITRGGCLIESERGQIDARIETRIARMLALLYR